MQILSNWYHQSGRQRTLLLTHSNLALNQLFDKLVDLDIDERHLVRLGHGSELLETRKDFTKNGRIQYMLDLRFNILSEVAFLAKSRNQPESVADTCELADLFFSGFIFPEWRRFSAELEEKGTNEKTDLEWVKSSFPFTDYFSKWLDSNLFQTVDSFNEATELAKSCWAHLDQMHQDIKACYPFEWLRDANERGNFLVTRQAKIVAMTTTFATINRKSLSEMGFTVNNILIEEAGQIPDYQTFIPLVISKPELQQNLKRIVLIGDHNQLPPVVSSAVIKDYSHFEQSMFTRYVRLKFPTITLDSQGRSRPAICSLYSWRYNDLKHLPHVSTKREFILANPGFKHVYQLINVGDYMGQGETQPSSHYFQNLGEAEYLIAVYMYMRLLGYPKENIVMLSTYNGQADLLKDIVNFKCANDPLYGSPLKITTVDKYQGQQSDYVLLSLVRTNQIGHFRDVRRMTVALSRARLGLYVFCREDIFANCYDISQGFSRLAKNGSVLELYPSETFSTSRKVDDTSKDPVSVSDYSEMSQIVEELHQQKSQDEVDKMEQE